MPGMLCDRLAPALALDDEQRIDEVVGAQRVLAHQAARELVATHATHACAREFPPAVEHDGFGVLTAKAPYDYSLQLYQHKPMPRNPTSAVPWSLNGNELYVDYHDNEWGVPAWDDRRSSNS